MACPLVTFRFLLDAHDDALFDVTAIINVAKDNPRYASTNGFLIDKQKNALIYAAPASSDYPLPEVEIFCESSLEYYQPEHIIFPETTKYIDSFTIYDNVNTVSVDVPGSVETIADYAFYAMGADEIILHYGIRNIGAGAFYDTEIEELYIPESVEWIGYDFCQYHVELFGQPSKNCHWETEDEFEERMNP